MSKVKSEVKVEPDELLPRRPAERFFPIPTNRSCRVDQLLD
jgi:hypothetical protein